MQNPVELTEVNVTDHNMIDNKVANNKGIDDKMFPVMLYNYLKQYIVGQSTYLETLCMKVYRYYKLGYKERPFMVIGPSGCGKTYTIEKLAQCKLLPKSEFTVLTYDATALTPNGFTGDSCSDISKLFQEKALQDKNYKGRGLIYLDEADKLFASNHSSDGDNISAIVQHQLMNFMVGGFKGPGFDTSKILFVLGGAFYELDELEKQMERKRAIGFGGGENQHDEFIRESSLRDNMITCGVQKEFLGRLEQIVKIDKLNAMELKSLLLHPERGVIARKRKSYREMDLDFEFSEALVDKIIQLAYAEDLGARSVDNMVQSILKTYDFHMLEKGYHHMYLDTDVITGGLPKFSKKKEFQINQC